MLYLMQEGLTVLGPPTHTGSPRVSQEVEGSPEEAKEWEICGGGSKSGTLLSWQKKEGEREVPTIHSFSFFLTMASFPKPKLNL